MIRRRKSAILSQAAFAASGPGRFLAGQTVQAAITPRAERVIELIQLRTAENYVDIGCETAAYAYLLAERAGRTEAPFCVDLLPGDRVDAVAWPEHLPFADQSVHALTSFYFIRRFDDDVVHGFGGELSRILAPGGSALLLEVAPVVNERLNRLTERVVAGGCAEVDLRGWGRLAALLTECEFDAIDLVNVGPFFVPPVPRVGVLLRRAG
jgi:SAM-dependent methyltransferase